MTENSATTRFPTAKIVCPDCGAVLSIRIQPNLDSKSVTCPVCRSRNPFLRFRRVENNAESTSYADPNTPTGSNRVGQIYIPASNQTFGLKIGRNIIGRQYPGSHADIQIRSTSKRMSREHLAIDVAIVPCKGAVHTVSLCKEVNATYVRDMKIEFGDSIVLNNDDVINLPDCEIHFVIPTDEA